MPKFLVTYHGTEMSHEPEAMARAREAFMKWAAGVGSALVDPGAPIESSRTIAAGGTGDGPADGPYSGWSVVEAADSDAALNLLRDHPFISRGGVLQVNQPAGI
jgi:hypothetical protein